MGILTGMKEVPKEMNLDRTMKVKIVGENKLCQETNREYSSHWQANCIHRTENFKKWVVSNISDIEDILCQDGRITAHVLALPPPAFLGSSIALQ